MPKVELHSIIDNSGWSETEELYVIVDGTVIAEGRYGGEPEDNSAGRTYSWVKSALAKLAKALGAEVEHITEETDVL